MTTNCQLSHSLTLSLCSPAHFVCLFVCLSAFLAVNVSVPLSVPVSTSLSLSSSHSVLAAAANIEFEIKSPQCANGQLAAWQQLCQIGQFSLSLSHSPSIPVSAPWKSACVNYRCLRSGQGVVDVGREKTVNMAAGGESDSTSCSR